jgi:hypothetical protein
MRQAVEQAAKRIVATPAGTRVKVEGKFGRCDWGRALGGLHKARWAAYDPDAITRLGALVELPERPALTRAAARRA